MHVGERIRSIRKKKGIPMKQLADMIGVSEQAVSQYELGKRAVKIDTAEKIASALGVPLAEIASPDIASDMELYEDIQKESADRAILSAMADMGYPLGIDAMGHHRLEDANGNQYQISLNELETLTHTTLDFLKFQIQAFIHKKGR